MGEDDTVILTAKEYAELRDRSLRTIYRWIESKKIKASKPDQGQEWEIEITVREYSRYQKRQQFKKHRHMFVLPPGVQIFLEILFS